MEWNKARKEEMKEKGERGCSWLKRNSAFLAPVKGT